MTNMTIRQVIWSVVALVALFVGAQNFFLAVKVKKLSSDVVQLASRHEPMLLAAKDLEIAVVQVQQWLQDISATRALNGLNDGFERAEQNAQLVYRQIEELSRLDRGQGNQYQALLPLFDNYYRIGKEMANLYIDQGPEAGNAMMPRFDEASEELQKRVGDLVRDIERRTQQVGQQAEREVALLVTLLWAAFGVLLLVVGCVAALLQLQVLRPIHHINELAKDIAHGEGDLTKRLTVKGRSELAEVALWFNSFIDKIHQLVSQVKNSVSELDREALSLKQVTELTNKNIAQQNQQTNQAAVAVSQMAATVTEVAQNAAIAADAAISADEETRKGSSAVSLTEQAIHNLAREIESAATVICGLESDSEKIGGVLDVIRGIAEQTNLLALNAAIEAARAGEQGRGFAVVADEVRNLASRTQESTEEIHGMIESLQRASEKAVSVMQDSQRRAAESVDKANAAGLSLKTIADTIARISDMNTQIATAAEQQSAMAVEIDNNIAAIKNVGKLTSDDADKTETSGRRLNEVAGELKRLVSQYRV